MKRQRFHGLGFLHTDRLRDALCDVDARADADRAHSRRVGRDLGAALAAETGMKRRLRC